MKKVRIIGSPRPEDPEPQQKLLHGMVLSVIPPNPDEPMEQLPESLLWVDYNQVIAQIEERGDKSYADFFRRIRNTPGGSKAPGLCISRCVCEVAN